MRFVRHLAAVVLVVAVIGGLGMLWDHVWAGSGGSGGSASAGPGPGGGVGRGPGPGHGPGPRVGYGHGSGPRVGFGHGLVFRHRSPRAIQRLEHGQASLTQGRYSASGVRLADASNLIRTILIEAGLAVVVVTVSVAWRRHRRTQRAAASA